ncbi:MAG: GNAT family N-acetyltransferase [Actinobacteria bacterium]|nr:GNAT family N-acetyltransferase [Actinomycetota bacterium]
MIFRTAEPADHDALCALDLGDSTSSWLAEVAEILNGLMAWRDDPVARDEVREVVVAEDDGRLVAVTAHVALVGDQGQIWPEHRYLMVTAVQVDHQRTGVGRMLVESVFADLADRGVRTVEWLVDPANTASIWFSRTTFPEAEESNPPEDRPYTLFVLEL